MDNLEKLWCHSVPTDEANCGKTISCSFAENIACYISNRNYMCTHQYHKLKNTSAVARITGNGKLKRVHYLSFYDTIFAATDFDMYVLGRHTFQTRFCFVMPKPVSELCWNPTESLLAVTFDSDEVALYSFSGCHFEPRYFADLHAKVSSSVYDEANPQEGGQDQIQRPQPPGEEVERLPPTDEPPKIVWRSKGDLIAVNFQKSGTRFIKVFDKELSALWMTEEYKNLGRPLSFSPSGIQLATSAISNKVNNIVIYEKTCKLRWVFPVPENKGVIKDLEYHPHMVMLAVYSIDDNMFGYINFYLCENEKWFLKHQLLFPPSRQVRYFQWVSMPEAAFTMCKFVVFTAKNIEHHTFRFIVNRCPKTSVVAAVDGKNVSFYNFAEKIIPTPMRVCTLSFERPINQILYHPKVPLAVVLDSKLQGYLIDVHHYTRVCSTAVMDLSDIAWFHDVDWSKLYKIQINVSHNNKDQHSVTRESSGWTLQIKTFEYKKPHYILPYNDTDSLISYKILDDSSCWLMYMTRRVLKIHDVDTTLDFTLSSNHEFFANKQLLCCGIMSLYIFKNYILLTTVDSKLYCIRLLDDTSVYQQEMDLTKFYAREVEGGARVINASNDEIPQIILHIPRGNIETVCCKLMAVDIIEQSLENNNWQSAIELMRTAKVNWNVLIDLNPERFMSHIGEFATAAEYCSVLSTIVNEFGGTDSSYHSYMPKTADFSCDDKRSVILKVLEYLITTNCAGNLTTIVSIQQKHVSVKAAVNSIKEVFLSHVCEYEIICKKALRHLLLKTHLKYVLQATYSLFDLSFLRFVYDNSGQDPKVYEPEIDELGLMDSVNMRFQMTLKANDPKLALKYLMRCVIYDGDYIEAFILKHKLEAYAYTTLPRAIRCFSLVAYLYARKLSMQRKYAEAGFILKRVDLLSEALEEFKKALDWLEVVVIMNFLEYDEDMQKPILYEVAEGLVRAHRLDEAVLVVEHYIKDYEKAVQILVDNKAFKKAMGVARLYGAEKMLKDTVIPRMLAHMADLSEKFDEYRATFDKYVQRLKKVREDKKISLDNQAPIDLAPDDPHSEAGSQSSRGSKRTSKSRSSTMSSRNRRKEEKKKTDLREGGHYEDIALIRALYLLYIDVFSLGQEVRDIGLTLEHGELHMARVLQEKLAELQEHMRQAIPEIWPAVFLIVPPIVDTSVLAIIQNRADLAPKFWMPPPDEILNAKWQLEMFVDYH